MDKSDLVLGLAKEILALEQELSVKRLEFAKALAPSQAATPHVQPRKRRTRRHQAKISTPRTQMKQVDDNGKGATFKKGQLTAVLHKAILSMPPGEFTSRDLIASAGLSKENEGSAFAAISRLSRKRLYIMKGSSAGKLRRV